MKVNRLCQKLGLPKVKYNHDIFLITDDSKDCIANSIFFAIRGSRVDGHDRIEDAIQNGAKTIVLEEKQKHHLGINYIYCKNAKRLLALFLKQYHRNIVRGLRFIGVVGTNGKTTTSTLAYRYFDYIGLRAMLIGSNGCFAKEFFKRHDNTTPRAVELYSYFCYAKRKKIQYVIMEVSSIAVSELRVMDMDFDCLIFTNFSEDHLDYHGSMDKYLFAKAIPFYKLKPGKYAILNMDDAASELILKHTDAKIMTYGIKNEGRIRAQKVYSTEYGIEFELNDFKLKANLLGEYNVYNILPLFCLQRIYHTDEKKLQEFIRNFKQVEGRMNALEIKRRHIIIDYAHTEEAVRQTILEVKRLAKQEVYVVVGCGGNREKEKRAKIGKLLSEIDCKPIITSDNPRFENPMDIIGDILSGIQKDVTVIENRHDAIIYALNQLQKEDYLLILGKGCEEYMDIRGHKEKYSDYAVVEEWARDNLR